MQIDPEDILASTFGRIVKQALLFASAVWIGSMVGGFALVIGVCGNSSRDAISNFFMIWGSPIWAGPLLLFSVWFFPNVVVLAGGVGYFITSENAGLRAWGVLAGLESFFVMAGWSMDLKNAWPIAIAWVSWLVILGMLETGVWWISQMLTKRRIRELAAISTENARHRAEREVIERLRMSREADR